MEEEGSKCVIQRIGIIEELDEVKAIIRIQGKSLTIPIDKLAPGLLTGDEVKWSGNRWVRLQA
ncbi:hypothetical protein ACFPYJ_23560 [Paenibacillus solisilvae]|uniref:Uncharacterized protein n=1 Tax=Paenibacillus solisilvae TaxID=2486751 RepID=A0ABW0W5N0_9BACL